MILSALDGVVRERAWGESAALVKGFKRRKIKIKITIRKRIKSKSQIRIRIDRRKLWRGAQNESGLS